MTTTAHEAVVASMDKWRAINAAVSNVEIDTVTADDAEGETAPTVQPSDDNEKG